MPQSGQRRSCAGTSSHSGTTGRSGRCSRGGVGEPGSRPRCLRGRTCGSSLADGSGAGVSAAAVSSADGSAATPAVADGSSSPAGVASLLRPNSDCCRFASWACSPASRSCAACKSDCAACKSDCAACKSDCAACKSDCAASSARWSCSQRAHADRPPTNCPFLLDFVLPTTTGLTARSYDGKVAQAKSSAQPIFSCLPIEPCLTPSTRSTDANRLLLRLPRNSLPQR